MRDLAPFEHDAHDLLVLTAAHVLADLAPGDDVDVIQHDDPAERACHLGVLRRAVPLAPLPYVAVDAAVVKPEVFFAWDNAANGVGPRDVNDLWRIADGTTVPVYKRGATSGLTTGDLMPVNADHRIADMGARYTNGWWTSGAEGLFADRGDSGSAVLDEQHGFVGLVVALSADPLGNPDEIVDAYVHGARQIFSALNVQLAAPEGVWRG